MADANYSMEAILNAKWTDGYNQATVEAERGTLYGDIRSKLRQQSHSIDSLQWHITILHAEMAQMRARINNIDPIKGYESTTTVYHDCP